MGEQGSMQAEAKLKEAQAKLKEAEAKLVESEGKLKECEMHLKGEKTEEQITPENEKMPVDVKSLFVSFFFQNQKITPTNGTTLNREAYIYFI